MTTQTLNGLHPTIDQLEAAYDAAKKATTKAKRIADDRYADLCAAEKASKAADQAKADAVTAEDKALTELRKAQRGA